MSVYRSEQRRPLRLEEAPELFIQFPLCGACDVELEIDPDSMVCPSCWTSWSHRAGGSDPGELTDFEFTDDDPVCPNDYAFAFATLDTPERDDALRRMNEARK